MKRDKIHAKDHHSKHTQEIRRQAMERAGGRCEAVWRWPNAVASITQSPPPVGYWSYSGTTGSGIANIYEVQLEDRIERCPNTEGLELHHHSYPKGRKLTVNHVEMLCDRCHNRLEAMKPHKANRRNAA